MNIVAMSEVGGWMGRCWEKLCREFRDPRNWTRHARTVMSGKLDNRLGSHPRYSIGPSIYS